MAGAAGFEPTHGGIKTRCLTAWLRPCKNLCASTLKVVRRERLELSHLAALEPKSSASTNSAIPACTGKVKVVATAGIEPATPAL